MASNIKDDLTCPVCLEIFRDPVVLSCSHSICNVCLKTAWNGKITPVCPLCRSSSKSKPHSSLVLKNLCNSVRNSEGLFAESKKLCSQHHKQLKLYCLWDEQLACVVCQTSKKHHKHTFCPIDEAAQEKKVKLKSALKKLHEKLEIFQQAKVTCDQTMQHIKTQVEDVEKQIKKNFDILHQFLHDQEVSMLATLRKEESWKSQAQMKKSSDIARNISSLSNDISVLSNEMNIGDIQLLQNIKGIMKRSRYTLQDPQEDEGELIDVVKYLGNLKFRMWERMQDIVKYTPVILDPNTAHPMLRISRDLTSVNVRDNKNQLPFNPERYNDYLAVVSSMGFTSGKHYWDVDVGNCANWLVGVTTNPQEKEGISGIVGMWFKKGQSGTILSSAKSHWLQNIVPSRLRVQLSFDRQNFTIRFSNSEKVFDTLTCSFTGRVYPYFEVRGKFAKLNILPVQHNIEIDI